MCLQQSDVKMAKVKVRMYATVREIAGTPEADVDATDLEGVLRALAETLGGKLYRLLDDDEGIVVLLNGRNVRRRLAQRVELKDRDEVSIFPPVSGG